MDEHLTPVVVAAIGVLQVILAVYFARRKNDAVAEKDEAGATEAISSSYSILVDRLETRLSKLEENYNALCDEYETNKIAWAEERQKLLDKCKEYDKKLEELVAENKRLAFLIDGWEE